MVTRFESLICKIKLDIKSYLITNKLVIIEAYVKNGNSVSDIAKNLDRHIIATE